MSFGLALRLRQAREAANLTQVELAEALEVSERTLQAWEKGTTPQPRHRRRLLAWLDNQERVAA